MLPHQIKENWYNICLQMTCHTFIWLHDWNNQWKLLYRTQILSLASNICILHGANERPWCSYSPYSLSLSLSLRRFLAFSHFGLERNQSKPVKSTTQHQIECIELCRTFGFHYCHCSIAWNASNRKSWKYATLVHNQIHRWSMAKQLSQIQSSTIYQLV